VLEIRGAVKTFFSGTPNEVRALQGVDLDVEPGSFTIVVGTNGSGKTTLQSAIAGSYRLDRGRIAIAGVDVTEWPEHRRARFLGRVFQNPFSGTAPDLTVAENLALAARRGERRGLGFALTARARGEMRERVRRLGMGLEDRLDNPIGSLSGGQRQALTLLMATWRRPELLLLDEHTAALDPRAEEQIMRVTEQVVRSQGLTTMMVTHSMEQAVRFGDRTIMMHRGLVVADLSGEERRGVTESDLLLRFSELRYTAEMRATKELTGVAAM